MKLTDKILNEAASYKQRFAQAARNLNQILPQLQQKFEQDFQVQFLPAEDMGREDWSTPPRIVVAAFDLDEEEYGSDAMGKVTILFNASTNGWEAYQNVNSDQSDTDYESISTRSLTELIDFAAEFLGHL